MREEIRERIKMIKKGEAPEGYKKTKLGIIPNDWDVIRIKECLERVDNPVTVETEKKYMQIGIRSHGKGLFYKEEVTGKELGNKKVFWIEPNCFIVNIVFAWEQAVGKTTEDEIGMIASHRFPMYRPINDKVSVDYLVQYFMTEKGKEVMEYASPGGAGRNRTLGQDRFMNSIIICPKYSEQNKITELIGCFDSFIAIQSKLIKEKKEIKRCLLQKLIVSKTKIIDKSFENKIVKLEKISQYNSSNLIAKDIIEDKGKFPVYDANGIIGYSGYYEKQEKYISIVKDGAGVGRLKVCVSKSSVIGTMGYIVPSQDIELLYLYQCLLAVNFNKYIIGATIPHIYYKDYSKEKIYVPSLEEQKAIAKVLTTADKEIELLEKQLEQIKLEKKAMMQLLLSGIVRVDKI